MNSSQTDPVNNTDLRYLALGDSYTIGESVEESERWPVQLVNTLRISGIEMDNAEIIAQTGWTTGELIEDIQARNMSDTYDIVSLLIGVNNQYRHLDTSEYRSELQTLMKRSVSFANGETDKVFIVSIPDYSVTPFAQQLNTTLIAEEIDAFNAIKREEAHKLGLSFIDITPISREAANDPSLLADDGLHPSGHMYKRWVEMIFPVVLEIVGEKK